MWGATADQLGYVHNDRFQYTLPVWGATLAGTVYNTVFQFQSTLPVWGATSCRAYPAFGSDISIHAPRVGSDLTIMIIKEEKYYISIHAPRVGSDDSFIFLPPYI